MLSMGHDGRIIRLTHLLQLDDEEKQRSLCQLFRIGDELGLLILDISDLFAIARYVRANIASFVDKFNVSIETISFIEQQLRKMAESGRGQESLDV